MGDPPASRATWLGHSTVLIEQSGARILTDPVLRKRLLHLRRHEGLDRPSPPGALDAILLSHHHFDHLDRPSLRELDPATVVIGSPGSQRMLRREGFRRVIELAPGEGVELDSVAIKATPAEHRGSRAPWHREEEAVGFLIEGDERVYFAGDTDLFDAMPEVAGSTDLALLPIWGWGSSIGPGHLDPERAAAALSLISPRVAIPIHWGTLAPLGSISRLAAERRRPAEEFVLRAGESAPATDVRILEPGEATNF